MRAGALLCLLGCVCAAWADSPPKVAFPYRFADHRVASADDLRVRCGVPSDQVLRYAVEIVELDPKGAPLAATARPAQFLLDPTPPDGEHQWAKVKPERPLEKDKSYRLSTLPQYPDAANQRSVAFEVSTYEFDTKASVSVVVPYAGGPQQVFQRQDGRLCFLLSSKVALDPASLAAGTIAEDLPPLHRPLDAEVPFELYKEDVPSSDQIGLAFIWISPPGPKSLDTHLTIAGVRNIFGAQVVVAAKERLKLAGAPKDNASSDLYVQLLSQAGPGSKPGWVADVKFSPALAHLGHGVFFRPLVLADIGLNTVQGNKFTNMIQTGLGVTKFVPTGWNSLPGIQLTPRALLETDRFGYHAGLGIRRLDRVRRHLASDFRTQERLNLPSPFGLRQGVQWFGKGRTTTLHVCGPNWRPPWNSGTWHSRRP